MGFRPFNQPRFWRDFSGNNSGGTVGSRISSCFWHRCAGSNLGGIKRYRCNSCEMKHQIRFGKIGIYACIGGCNSYRHIVVLYGTCLARMHCWVSCERWLNDTFVFLRMHITKSREHFGFSSKTLGLSIAAQRAMPSQTMSGWSCATLRDGVDGMDLDIEEQELLKLAQATHWL